MSRRTGSNGNGNGGGGSSSAGSSTGSAGGTSRRWRRRTRDLVLLGCYGAATGLAYAAQAATGMFELKVLFWVGVVATALRAAVASEAMKRKG